MWALTTDKVIVFCVVVFCKLGSSSKRSDRTHQKVVASCSSAPYKSVASVHMFMTYTRLWKGMCLRFVFNNRANCRRVESQQHENLSKNGGQFVAHIDCVSLRAKIKTKNDSSQAVRNFTVTQNFTSSYANSHRVLQLTCSTSVKQKTQ